jgi:hypothetical protein
LKALSDPKLFIGVGVLIALAGAIAVSALAFQLFGDDINWPNVLIGVGVLALMALGLYAIGNMASQMLLGSLAILAVSASLLVAGFAFGLFSNIDWGNVFIGLGALAVLAIAAIGLSFVAPHDLHWCRSDRGFGCRIDTSRNRLHVVCSCSCYA